MLLGTITLKEKKIIFERGIKGYPSADDPVYSVTYNELKAIYSGDSGIKLLEIGQLSTDESQSVTIDIENLFQNHFAVLGATGSGKTCTLVNMIQNTLMKTEYKSCHFVILDPHGEYGKAFDTSEYSSQVLYLKIGGKETTRYNQIPSISIDLPHYYFNFDEYKALFRPAPQTQEPALRECIASVRRETLGEEVSDDIIIADKPIPFEIEKLYNKIFNTKRSDTEMNRYLGSLGYRIKVTSGLEELGFIFHPKPDEFDVFIKSLFGFDKNNVFHKITIVDLSSIPRIKNLMVIITNLIGRCIFDNMRKRDERAREHCLVVLEEAHNYVPREFKLTERSSEYDYTLNTFETIAKEGRKYGVCIALSSQRPRDLSESVLSQCGTYFIHRLSNIGDKSIIEAAASEIDESLLQKMPILKKQTCVIMGDAIKNSAEVKINSLKYAPSSASAQIDTIWRNDPILPIESEIIENIVNEQSENEEPPF